MAERANLTENLQMTYTILTLTLVGIILLFWLYNLMKNCFSRAFCVLKSRNNGSTTTKDASIISVETIKKGKKPLLELLLLFENFSGQHIHRKIRVWDTKPHLNRFQTDKTIQIGINIARKPKDPIFLSQKPCRFSFIFVIICSLKMVIYVIGSYILVGEALEKIFASPEAYELIFKNSNTWQIGLILIGMSIFIYSILRQTGVLVNGKTLDHNWNLLFYGIGATASVSRFKNTGALIKRNPVFHFSYLFKTHTGEKVEGNDKIITENKESLIEMDKIDVMYLPGDPSISRIAENLETQGFSGFLNTLFMVVVFLFSVVVVFSFYQTVFGVEI